MVDGEILLLRMSGPLTASTLAGFAADAVESHGHRAKGFILDYRPGVIVATADELGRMLASVPEASPLRRPGAFVGDPGKISTLRVHALRMAKAGFRRRVFIDTLTAHDWILDRLRV